MTDAPISHRYRPAARVVANGRDITTMLLGSGGPDGSRPLVSLTVTDEAGVKSDTVELVIDNRAYFGVPPIGSKLHVWLGYEPAPMYMGEFRIEQWEIAGPPSLLTLSGQSAELTTSIKAKKSRSWHETTVGDVVRKIAGEHKLGTAVDSEIGARQVEHIDQQSESDLHFLSRLARRNGATFKLADGKVIFAAKGSRKLPSGAGKPVATITPKDVSTYSVMQSERGGHKSAVAYYQDHAKGKRVAVTAGAGEPRHMDPRLYRTEAEAKAAAAATLGDLKRGRREAQLDGPGMPDIFAEGLVRLRDFHPDADGDYLAKSVTHSFSSGGFTTAVTLETGGKDEVADS